ncbi:MAG: RNA polymerase sigma factor [bacterium]|nr:RNA polymerase sigma factor [bacterium]
MTDPPSFNDVQKDLSGPLLRYLERLTGNQATADDLLQDTLLKISRGLAGFEGRSSVKTWAFSIATRVTVDHFRKPESKVHVVAVDESDELPSDGLDVDRPLIVGEMNDCIRNVIDSLPGDYRAALVLHDLEGHSAKEVAEIVGCSLPTAKIRIHRARARLRESLEHACTFYKDDESVLRCDRKPST